MPAPTRGGLAAASSPSFPDALLPALQEALGLTSPDGEMPPPQTFAWYRGRRVLVTGAGGSIGSELCRQLLRLRPSRLVLLERDEYSLFEIDRQLQPEARALAVELVPVLCDLRHAGRVEAAFRRHAPQVVLHAAACKHVPLLEDNAAEAVSTNLSGTRVLMQACEAAAVGRCLLVSTDKAVEPASLMGATKCINEWMFSARRRAGEQSYRWVRLGNVLGSRGSVVPIFRDQILHGGPVTLTDPGMTRYFIGLHQAAAGILLAAAVESSAHRFLLEMGEPVRVCDLAQAMIRLLADGRKVEVRATGRRPGERMHERLLHADEQAVPSPLAGLLVIDGREPAIPDLPLRLQEIEEAAEKGHDEAVRILLAQFLAGYASGAMAAESLAWSKK